MKDANELKYLREENKKLKKVNERMIKGLTNLIDYKILQYPYIDEAKRILSEVQTEMRRSE